MHQHLSIRLTQTAIKSLYDLARNIISFTYHTYQQELYPTGIRARAVGFAYSWSRLFAVFSSFIIAHILGRFGVSEYSFLSPARCSS
ncbi:hypothetical protein HNR39_000772 [Glaciimonas immobilis]|uniref:MFS transporter n=1 Tax=Glaciimonas immobilis TaxID=728004 RepID=A0A840RPB0_9BURK|nr:hypothetical protein [Glaciimonas immobilis]